MSWQRLSTGVRSSLDSTTLPHEYALSHPSYWSFGVILGLVKGLSHVFLIPGGDKKPQSVMLIQCAQGVFFHTLGFACWPECSMLCLQL